MSTTRKSANPSAAEPGTAGRPARRRRVLLGGALLGWALAQLVGTLLDVELRPLRFLFILLSSAAGAAAALLACGHFAGLAGPAEAAARRRRTRLACAALALGVTALALLYTRFVVRIHYDGHAQSVAFLVGPSRSASCGCIATKIAEDGDCIKALGLDVDAVRSCWNDRWVIELALTLAYLWTLGSLGAIVGLLAAPGAPPAPERGYLDFDVWIDRREGSGYRAKAWSGGAGFEGTTFFTLPPSLESGEPFRFGLADAYRGGPTEASEVTPEQVGEELFRTVFQGELLKSFLGCLEAAKDGPGVRIRLRLNDVPHLACLPWEYLCDARGRGFLALSKRTSVVRYLELSEAVGTLQVEPPLRILVVLATPKGYEELAQADEEWRRLREALSPLLASRRIVVERLPRPTLEALAERLQTGSPCHILQFMGHGGWSELCGEGVLIFEDEAGQGAPVTGKGLAYLLQDHPSLRLAVLNACNGARASREDAFAGTAQALVQHGVPAVVAMQAEVTDSTACRFAESFYQGLASGLPVDACVGEARKALAAEANPEWGTPVLYLRAADGRLFAVDENARARAA